MICQEREGKQTSEMIMTDVKAKQGAIMNGFIRSNTNDSGKALNLAYLLRIYGITTIQLQYFFLNI